jgi:hypothetical protein
VGPRSRSAVNAVFPNLRAGRFLLTSPATAKYNCIAWAAGETSKWWWPTPGVYYWPAGIPSEETLDAFVAAFATLGFSPSNDGALESGFEKVALYALAGRPTHMARQLASGKWTSKLGRDIDIEHETPIEVESPLYGTVARFLRRAR